MKSPCTQLNRLCSCLVRVTTCIHVTLGSQIILELKMLFTVLASAEERHSKQGHKTKNSTHTYEEGHGISKPVKNVTRKTWRVKHEINLYIERSLSSKALYCNKMFERFKRNPPQKNVKAWMPFVSRITTASEIEHILANVFLLFLLYRTKFVFKSSILQQAVWEI